MRLITRGDLDGLTSAVLLMQKEQIDELDFAHPRDMQDGLIDVQPGDIIANLPYHPNASLWFDHHESEEEKAEVSDYKGLYGVAPSAARLVYRYYNDRSLDKFGELLSETDRVDSARLAVEDVLHPEGWVLLSYTLDPRSGLGQFKQYFRNLAELAGTASVDEVMLNAEVVDRAERFLGEQERFEAVTREFSYLDRGVIITDFRELDTTPVGNRFLVYTVYPQGSISVRVFWGKNRQNVVAAIGHSIFNRSSKVHVGNLCGKFGGGGLKGAGTVQFSVDEADAKIVELLSEIRAQS
jgi:nanoRNase/pAp phosphatase (c-di-AMP/oligoRNAs hydrolase)